MNEENMQALAEIKFDGDQLYREEVYTDLRVGSIKQLIPVTRDGSRDLSRAVVFLGEAQLMSQMGPLPVQAKIEAENLEAAIAAFPQAIQVAVEAMIDEVKELQRREMSRIVVPGTETVSKITKPK
jgi:hypothetical protein